MKNSPNIEKVMVELGESQPKLSRLLYFEKLNVKKYFKLDKSLVT